MRWTTSSLVGLIAALAVACGKSAAKMAEEVRACSAITMDAKGAAQCLVLQYRWKEKQADSAATAFERHADSLAQAQADSAWRAEASRHKREVEQCAVDPSGEIARCLAGFGWADARAAAAEDSLWRHDVSRHKSQLLACTRQRQMQTGACLQLYYKWSPERALAVDDSIRRAHLAR